MQAQERVGARTHHTSMFSTAPTSKIAATNWSVPLFWAVWPAILHDSRSCTQLHSWRCPTPNGLCRVSSPPAMVKAETSPKPNPPHELKQVQCNYLAMGSGRAPWRIRRWTALLEELGWLLACMSFVGFFFFLTTA